jgi:hypothetical protein
VSLEVVKGILAQVERPVGILTVRLVEAVNIPKTDFCSESDPYFVYAALCPAQLSKHNSL